MCNRPGLFAAIIHMSAMTSIALAQAQLEVRIRAQDGAPPGVVADNGTDTHTIANGTAARLRFELQYRILDSDLADAIDPCGLCVAGFDITGDDGTPPGTSRPWRLDRAQLTRFEASLATSTPPTATDDSGLPTGVLAEARGLHRPFRVGIPAPLPNNSAPINGRPSADGRTLIAVQPLTIAPNAQGPCGQSSQGAWFGAYSFDVVIDGPVDVGAILIRATSIPPEGNGSNFAFWNGEDPVPLFRIISTSANATVLISGGVPAVETCCAGQTCVVVTFPDRCSSIGATLVGVGSQCDRVPAPCCPADVTGSGLTIDDLFQFLAWYFARDMRANFNHLGNVTVQDLLDYVGAYLAGCE